MSGLLPRDGTSSGTTFDSITCNNITVNNTAIIRSLITSNLSFSNISATTATVSGLATVGNLKISIAPTLSTTLTALVRETDGTININSSFVDLSTAQVITSKTINSASNTVQVNGTNINNLINQDLRTSASPSFQNLQIIAGSSQLIITKQDAGTTQLWTFGTGIKSLLSGTYDIVGTSLGQILTNKTLTLPVITSISNSGTVTIPTGTDTLVNLNGVQALTNKTINSASNTLQVSGTNINSLISATNPLLTTSSPTFASPNVTNLTATTSVTANSMLTNTLSERTLSAGISSTSNVSLTYASTTGNLTVNTPVNAVNMTSTVPSPLNVGFGSTSTHGTIFTIVESMFVTQVLFPVAFWVSGAVTRQWAIWNAGGSPITTDSITTAAPVGLFYTKTLASPILLTPGTYTVGAEMFVGDLSSSNSAVFTSAFSSVAGRSLTGSFGFPTSAGIANQLLGGSFAYRLVSSTFSVINGTVRIPQSIITPTSTLTLPSTTDTLVGRDTTDTLTSKTIAGLNATGAGVTFYTGKCLRFYASATTVGAVTSTINTIGTPNNTNIIVNALITGFCTVSGGLDLGKYVGYSSSYVANNNAGTLTVATIASNNARSGSFAGATVTITSSGTALLIQVNGIAGDTIAWTSEVNIIYQ